MVTKVENIILLPFSLGRINIRENVDVIHLQKELSDKSTALRAAQMKYDDLQKVRHRDREVFM